MKRYFGFSSSQHDSSVAVVDSDGQLLFAEGNERPLKSKRAWQNAPDSIGAIEPILKKYALDADIVTATSWSESGLKWVPLIFSATYWQKQMLGVIKKDFRPGVEYFNQSMRQAMYKSHHNHRDLLLNLEYRLFEAKNSRSILRKKSFNHHTCHAATACWTSSMTDALCVVVDGMGEGTSTSVFRMQDSTLHKISSDPFLNMSSLGLWYSLVCWSCGFDPIGGEEWKVMGLAPYGKFSPEYDQLLRPMLTVNASGLHKSKDYNRRSSLLCELRKKIKHPLEAADLAFTAQSIFEEIMCQYLNQLHERWGGDNLILTGGCALNSSCNGVILSRTPFKKLHIPMAPGDDGNSVGAAWLAWSQDNGGKSPPRATSPYLGSELSKTLIERVVSMSGFKVSRYDTNEELTDRVATELAAGRLVGWAQGRAEFGPRALGNRSILADPRSLSVKDRINASVKFREEFRPFAPSVLKDKAAEYFYEFQESPYMERTLRFSDTQAAPGVVHVNNTGRLHTVCRESNPLYYDLLNSFYKKTNVPMLLNTSFNVMGRPIVHDVEDCVSVFASSGLDVLVMGPFVMLKS